MRSAGGERRKKSSGGSLSFERRSEVIVSLITVFLVLALASADAIASGWISTGNMNIARNNHRATLLPNGKVLVTGGYNNSGGYLKSAELYDPNSNTWSDIDATDMITARDYHVATLLPNGKVLVAGGYNNSGSLSSAELYDPGANSWSGAGNMNIAHASGTATLLPNGKVLVAGGNCGSYCYSLSAELYDPPTNSWSGAGNMSRTRDGSPATLLPNGKVLVAGGYNGSSLTNTAELYDSVTNSWSGAGSMSTARQNHTATLLPNGKVLVAGGWTGASLTNTAELYDPVTNTWSLAGNMSKGRYMAVGTLLPNGKVLVVGGDDTDSHYSSSAELYDPVANTWSNAGSMSTARNYHSGTLLNNGKFLVAGGSPMGGDYYLQSAELYDPSSSTATLIFNSYVGTAHASYDNGAPQTDVKGLGQGNLTQPQPSGSGESQYTQDLTTHVYCDPHNPNSPCAGAIARAYRAPVYYNQPPLSWDFIFSFELDTSVSPSIGPSTAHSDMNGTFTATLVVPAGAQNLNIEYGQEMGITSNPTGTNTLTIKDSSNNIIFSHTQSETNPGSGVLNLIPINITLPPGGETYTITIQGSGNADATPTNPDSILFSTRIKITVGAGGPPGPTCIIPPSGLVSWWDGDGDADDIWGSNDGTPQDNVTFAPGKVGNAFSFDGSYDYVDAGTNDVFNFNNGAGDFTIDAWIYPNSLSTTPGIVSKATYGPYTGWTFLIWADGTLDFADVGDYEWNFTSAPGLITTGVWTHVAVTKQGSNYKLFKNGVGVASTTHSPNLHTSTTSLKIGTVYSNHSLYWFNGRIDEVEIFNRGLSDSEILNIYNAGSAGKCKTALPYTITATAGNGGTISPSGAVPVIQGASQTFTITPNLGYHVADVLVDGASVGALTSYTFTNVMTNHTISASFAVDTYTLTVNINPAGGGGVSPSGGTYNSGTSVQLTATANPGYTFSSWSGLGNGDVGNGNVATITMNANKTITANFTQNQYTTTVTFDTVPDGTPLPYGGTYCESGMIATSYSNFSSFSDPLNWFPTNALYFHGNNQDLGQWDANVIKPYHAYIEFRMANGSRFDLQSLDIGTNQNSGTPERRWIQTSAGATFWPILPDGGTVTTLNFSGPDYSNLEWFRVGTVWFATEVDNITFTPLTPANCPPDGCTSPPSGLVSWWDGDSISGNTAYDIKGDYNGTMVGGVSIVPGIVGQAFSFNGVNDFVEISHDDIFNPTTGAFTVDGWFYIDPTAQGNVGDIATLVSKSDGSSCPNQTNDGVWHQGGGWALLFDDRHYNATYCTSCDFSKSLRFAVYVNCWPNFPEARVDNIVNQPGWYHIAGVFDKNATPQAKLYLNGNLIAQSASTSYPIIQDYFENTYSVRIGAMHWNEEFNTPPNYPWNDRFNGKADEVEFFNVALTQQQIQQIYDAGIVGKCKSQLTYTITSSAGANGSISPSGAVNVNYGGSQTFTITPNTGYRVVDVVVDGASVGAVTSYTFTNVMANHTIVANFAILTYTIDASAGPNGSISPSGSIVVNYGANPTFGFTPNPGYQIEDVLVDGVSVGPVISYTFSAVTANHTISTSFKPVPAVTGLTVANASGSYGGTTTFSATLTSGGSGVSGKTISFLLMGNPAGTNVTNASGVATLSGVSLAGIIAGTYPTGVGASFAGDANYSGSGGSAQLTVNKLTADVFLNNLSQTYDGTPKSVTVTTNPSWLSVEVKYNGNTTPPTNAGSYSVVATVMDPNYTGSASGTLVIGKASQEITFGVLSDKHFGDPDFTVSAAGGASGQPVTFTASGSCTVAGNTVHITDVGSCTITAHQAGDANYQAAPDVAQSFSITDNTAPNTTVGSGPQSPTNATSATFTFSGTDDVTAAGSLTFECQLDSGNFISCTSAKTYSGLTAGSHTFSVRAIDAAGNVDSTPASWTWTIDLTAPDVILDGFPLHDPTNQTSATFAFHASEDNSTLKCSLNGAAFAACSSPVSYNGLLDATHTFAVRATDQAGNQGAAVSFTWTVDTAAPETTIDTSPDGITRSNTAVFTFHGSDPSGGTFECSLSSLNGGAFVPCSSPVTYNGLADGTYTFALRATDAANNTDLTPDSFTWIIDNQEPNTQITSGPAEGSTTTETSATFEFTGNDNVTTEQKDFTFECSLDGAAFAACTTPTSYTGLSRAQHSFQVRAKDQAGNTDSSPATRTWTINKVAATVTLGNLTQTYTGSQLTPSVTTNPVGLAIDWTNAPQTNAGSYSVTATINDTNYQGSASDTFTISKAQATVTLGNLTQTYDGTPKSASATTAPAGLTVLSFTYDGSSTAPTNAGSYAVVATLDNANYQGSSSGTLVIGKASATISLSNLSHIYDGTQKTATATTTPPGLSGVAITYNGSTTAPTAAGSYAVAATLTNDNYQAPNATGTLVIAKATATVTLSNLIQTYTGSQLTPTATTSPVGLTIVWTGAPQTNAGTYPVTATVNDANYQGSASGTFVIGKAAASVTLGNLTQTYDGTPKSVTVTISPSVSYSVTYNGSATAPTSAGNYTVVATVTDPNYTGSATDMLVIGQASQTITFGALADKHFGDSDFTVSATGGASGQPVTFTASGSCTVTGDLVHITGVGSCTITAHQAGNANYQAAPDVPQSFSITDNTPPNTTVDSGPQSPTNATSAIFTFSGTDDVTVAGSLTFECQLDSGGFSTCTSPKTYTGLTAGSRTFYVRAKDAAGNVDSTPASWSWTIDLTPPDVILDGFPLHDPTNQTSATFAFHASEPNSTLECSLDGAAFAACSSPVSYSGLLDAPHTFAVRSRDQAGNQGAATSFSWTVDTAAPDTTIDTAPDGITQSNTAVFTFHGSDPSGDSFECSLSSLNSGAFAPCSSPVTYNGLADGTYTFAVRATDEANNTDLTPDSFTWVIDNQEPDTQITSGPADGSTTTSTDAVFDFTGSDNVTTQQEDFIFECSLDGAAFETCTIPASYTGLSRAQHSFQVRAKDQAGNTDSSSATRAWTIDKMAATVALSNLTQTYTGSALYPTATTTPGGLTIIWTGAPQTNAGSYSVTATINDTNYQGSSSSTFTINKAPASVTLGNLNQTYDGSAKSVSVTTTPSGLATSVTYDGSATAPTNAGSYAVVATVNDSNYEGSASGTLVISKANATISLSNLSHIYDGTPKSATATTTPAGLSGVTITYNGSPTAPTGAGSYAVVASLTNANYQATDATGTLVIAKASAAVTLGSLSQTYTGSALTPTATTIPAGLTIVWTGAPQTNAGSYPVTATVNDANYQGSASGTFVINKAPATVTLGNMTQTYTGSALTPTATTNPSGLTIVWTGMPQTNAGSYPVMATINDANYEGSASGTFVINKAVATVTLSNMTQTYTGSALTPTATTTPVGLTIIWTGAPQINAGSYPVTATINDANYQGSASGTFTINKAAATVTLGNLTQTYTGSALTPSATTSPAGLAIVWTGAPQADAGSYSVTATVSDSNYEGSASGTFVISKADQIITFNALSDKTAGDSAFPISASSTSGLAVSFESLTTGICTVAGNTVTLTNKAGLCTIEASQGGNDNYNAATPISQSFTVNPGVAVAFSVSGPTSTTAGSSFDLTVTAKDAYNNVATGYLGTVKFASTDGQASLPGNTTLDSGTKTFSSVILKTSGTQYIDATDTVTSSITGQSGGIAVNPSTATLLSVVAPASATAGSAISVTVTAKDTYNNTATGYAGIVHLTSPDDPQAVLPSNYSFVPGDSGTKSFSVTLKTSGTQYIDATDIATSSITGDSGSIAVSAAAASNLVFDSQPSSSVAGQVISPAVTVKVEDQFDNVVTPSSAAVSVAIGTNPGSGTLSGTFTVNAVNGIATFSDLSIDKVGAGYTLSASSSGLTPSTSDSFNITFATLVKFAISTIPSPQTAGTGFSISITAQDAYSNTVTSFTGTANITSTGNLTSGGTTAAFVNGVLSSHSVTISNSGDFTLTATANGKSGTSNTFTVNKATQTINFGVLSNKTYGDAPFTVSAIASSGLPVSFSIFSGPATIAGNTVTLTGAGSVTVRASQEGNETYSAATPVDQSFTVNQKSASVTPAAASKTYGAADPAFTGTLSGFLTGDGVTATYSRTAGESVAGSPYTISATLNPAGVLGNYTITYNTASFTINKKAITVTADAKSKIYGTADPPLTYTFSPALVSGDSFTGALSRVAGEAVGTYAIQQGTLALNSNYTLTFVGANLTITGTTNDAILLIQNLTTYVKSCGLPKETENSLTSKLDNAIKSLQKGNETAAINQINAFINEVNAQRGKKIPADQADHLISEAKHIIDVINL